MKGPSKQEMIDTTIADLEAEENRLTKELARVKGAIAMSRKVKR